MKRFLSLLVVLWLLQNVSVIRGETTWNLVTDATSLAAGDQIIIAAANKDFAISTTQNPNNRGQAAIVKNGNQCTLSADVQIITLKNGTKPNSFALSVGNGFLYAASSSENYLKTQDNIDDNASFVFEFDNEGKAKIAAQGENKSNCIRYYNSKLFSCYKNQEKNVRVYRKNNSVYHTVTYNENGALSQLQFIDGEDVTLKTPAEINGFVPQGWTLNPMAPSDLPPADLITALTVTEDVTLYAVYALENYCDYEKITAPLNDYSGTYLIVNEENNVAFNGNLDVLDVANNIVEVQAYNNVILSDKTISNAEFTITKENGCFTIRSASGFYIGRVPDSNGMNTSQTQHYENTISIDENGNAIIKGKGSTYLNYNSTSNNRRFRYYSNSQEPIQLYKKSGDNYRCFCTSIDVIENPLTITEDTTWNEPTSLSNMVTINNNAKLTARLLGNKNADYLIIENGQIECNEGVFGTLTKSIGASSQWGANDLANDGWYGISSPVGTVGTSTISGLCTFGTNDYDLYSYSESEAIWLNSKDTINLFDKISVGEGYLYASKEGTVLMFSGEFNSRDIYKTLEYQCDNVSLKGFNFLGNPFPKSITLGNIQGAVLGGFYLATNAGAWEAHLGDNDVVEPGEAFLVQTNAETQICIKKEAGITRNDADDAKVISLVVENEEYKDVAYAVLCEKYDNEKQLWKIPHRNAAIHSVSIDNKAIAMFDDDIAEFAVSLKAPKTKKYVIRVKPDAMGNNEFSYLHLFDKLTGNDIDMLSAGSYEFVGSPRDDENRFVVRLRADNNGDDNEGFVYQNDNNLIVNSKGHLQIFDLLGRVVISKDINGESVSVENLDSGVYIVRMTFNNSVRTQKIIVK